MYSGPCLLQLNEHHIAVVRGELPGEYDSTIIKLRSEDIERVSFDRPQDSLTFHIKSCEEFYTFILESADEVNSLDEMLKEYYFSV